MKGPILRSEYRPLVPPARDEGGRCKPETRSCHIEARACAGRALLLEADYTRRYDVRDSWHDPLSGHSEPFERALARARKDAVGGRLERFARLVTHTEVEIACGDGWTATTTEHGVQWREPNAEGTLRTLTEAVGVIMARTQRESTGDAPPVEPDRSVVREGYDQRPEGQGDEVAQAPSPDPDAGLPDFILRPPGMDGHALKVGGGVTGRERVFERAEYQDHDPSMGPLHGPGVTE